VHQILGLRDWFDEKKQKWVKTDNTFAKRGWGDESLDNLFENLNEHLAKIPEKERFNLFYTVANCTDQKRDFSFQKHIVFDVDGANATTEAWQNYWHTVAEALSVDPLAITVILSGNGFHFILDLKDVINETAFFDKNRKHYDAICSKINAALVRSGLPGKADPAVFDASCDYRAPSIVKKESLRKSVSYLGTQNLQRSSPSQPPRVYLK
jgi:hypothetical protein